MEIDDRKLRHLTDEVDQLHHESLRSLPQALGDAHLDAVGGPVRRGRRRFLVGAGAGSAAAVAVSALPLGLGRLAPAWAQDPGTGPSKFPSPDEKIATAAQVLEKTLVAAYGLIAPKVTDAALRQTITTFQSHHDDHAKALGKVLKQSDTDVQKVAADPPRLASFQIQISAAADHDALIGIALSAEVGAAATYLQAIAVLKVALNAGAVATILPVEAQHAAVLAQALGRPVEETLPDQTPTTGALDLSPYARES